MEFAAWDSILRILRVRSRKRVWVRLTPKPTPTLTLALGTLLARNKSNHKLQTPNQLHTLEFYNDIRYDLFESASKLNDNFGHFNPEEKFLNEGLEGGGGGSGIL